MKKPTPKYRRILLKLSGEALGDDSGRGINPEAVRDMAQQIGEVRELGVQVVIEDYVHGPLLKVFLLLLNRFAHVFVAIAAAFAVLRISLGNNL